MASADANAADMRAVDEQTFLKEHASNVGTLDGALNSVAELKAKMAAIMSKLSKLTTLESPKWLP